MAGPWVTDEVVSATFAAAMQAGGTALVEDWQTLLAVAHGEAYREIVNTLRALGYTQAQLDTWLLRADYELRLTMAKALASPSYSGELPAETLARWQIDWAKAFPLLDDGGEVIELPDTVTGAVSSGTLSTARDQFQLDPCKPNPWEAGYRFRR